MTSRASKQKKQSSEGGFFNWLWRYSWKLMIVALTVLAAYMVYLDGQIQGKFNGNKWQVPAQIYARHMILELKQEITVNEIIEELELLGYRKVTTADSTGEYHVRGNRLRIMRRAFHFPDGFQREGGFNLLIKNNRVADIEAINSKSKVSSMRLEPWLVTRLVSSGREDRMLVSIGQVPDILKQALVSVEDKDFYEHHGVAPLSIMRALMANISAGKAVQGGSTLTQQLVKNLFLTREKTITRKAREALMALVIDARYSKEVILEAYLNEVFLGQNGAMAIHGFGLASHFYFDRPLRELNVVEMATLVGIIKGPSYYNPRRFPERVAERRNLVLRHMFDDGHIDRASYESMVSQPVKVASGASFVKGKHPAFMDQVRRELSVVLANPDVRQSGVKVFTTLDPIAQRKAEKAIGTQLGSLEKAYKQKNLQAAMVITDIDTAEIRAIVGGRDTTYAGFNRALDAKRSVGSLIKPAIYLTALEQAGTYHLASPLEDNPIKMKSTGGSMWEPKNADKKFRGQVPLIDALVNSLNVPTVSLGLQLGLPTVVDAINRLGVEDDIRVFPALTLGALELSPLQVNQMYQTMANYGRFIPLHTVHAILSPEDQLLWRHDTLPDQRFDESATYLLNYALHKVTLEGTAKSLRNKFKSINMAGKTGTTDDYRDSWFSGYDNNMLITSWVGRDDNESTGLTGAKGALTLYERYQSSQAPKSLVRRFPEGLGIAHFAVADGRVSQPGCPDTISVPAILDSLPQVTQRCRPDAPARKKKKSWWERIFG